MPVRAWSTYEYIQQVTSGLPANYPDRREGNYNWDVWYSFNDKASSEYPRTLWVGSYGFDVLTNSNEDNTAKWWQAWWSEQWGYYSAVNWRTNKGNFKYRGGQVVPVEKLVIEDVNHIGAWWFEGLIYLNEIIFKTHSTKSHILGIGDGAFKGCTRLKKLEFSNLGMPKLGNYAFQNCTSLQEVNAVDHDGVASLGKYVFSGCTALSSFSAYTSSKLTEKCKEIPEGMFQNCRALWEFTVDAAVEKLEITLFRSVPGLKLLQTTAPNRRTYSRKYLPE
jgi:hypothetical protein